MKPRTSSSHPLRIDGLPAAHGRLGLTFCPGKCQTWAATGAWQRDLDLDLDVVQQWDAAAVVTALESPEMEDLGVSRLGEGVEARGMDWHHMPIRDGHIPGPVAEARWYCTSLRLRRLLASGRGVLIHCMGGLGRTGTLAVRLLVELGQEPREALAAVRATRPGAVETPEQERYVLALAPGAPLGEEPSLDERVLGCLLGGAIGDAFGYAVEFLSLEQIRSRFGPGGLREPVYDDGQLVVSDDTQMTLFSIEGLLRAAGSGAEGGLANAPEAVFRAYLRWLLTQGGRAGDHGQRGWLLDEQVLWQRRAPGNTCLGALSSGVQGTVQQRINDSKGCGGVMRVAPVGLLAGLVDADAALSLGADLAALTHGHPNGFHPAGALAAIVRHLLDGVGIQEATERAKAGLYPLWSSEETASCMRQALEATSSGEDAELAVRRLGEGWVGEEALAIALYAAQLGESFEEVVTIAANHDGDSDSTASIAGQIWGARYGLTGLPQAWLRRLDVLDPLLTLAHDLAVLSAPGRHMLQEYPAA